MNEVAAAGKSESIPQAQTSSIPFPDFTRAACCLFGLMLAMAAVTSRALYADGANWFLQVLEKQTFVPSLPCRMFSCAVIQWPLVLLIKLGVTNLSALRFAFGVGCFLPWAIGLWICHRLAPRFFWLVLVGCAAGYLNAAFMAIGEHIVTHAFFWPPVFAILFVRPLTRFAAIALIGSATILLFSYESLAFLGPPLAATSLWRAVRGGERGWRRWTFIAATILFLTATGIAIQNVLHPLIPAQLSYFRDGLQQIINSPGWTEMWTAGWVLLMVAMALPAEKISRIPFRHFLAAFAFVMTLVFWRQWGIHLPRGITVPLALFVAVVFVLPEFSRFINSKIGIVLLGGMVVLWGLWPMLSPMSVEPYRQYYERSLNLVVPFSLLPVAHILAFRPRWLAGRQPVLISLAAALLFAQSLWHIGATWQWNKYIGTLKSVLASRAGPVEFGSTPLAATMNGFRVYRFDWSWANPSLSIALSSDGKIASLLLPSHPEDWEPFKPLIPATLPDLSKFNVDYSGYVSSLKALETK
jgi:hypothetical protein